MGEAVNGMIVYICKLLRTNLLHGRSTALKLTINHQKAQRVFLKYQIIQSFSGILAIILEHCANKFTDSFRHNGMFLGGWKKLENPDKPLPHWHWEILHTGCNLCSRIHWGSIKNISSCICACINAAKFKLCSVLNCRCVLGLSISGLWYSACTEFVSQVGKYSAAVGWSAELSPSPSDRWDPGGDAEPEFSTH